MIHYKKTALLLSLLGTFQMNASSQEFEEAFATRFRGSDILFDNGIIALSRNGNLVKTLKDDSGTVLKKNFSSIHNLVVIGNDLFSVPFALRDYVNPEYNPWTKTKLHRLLSSVFEVQNGRLKVVGPIEVVTPEEYDSLCDAHMAIKADTPKIYAIRAEMFGYFGFLPASGDEVQDRTAIAWANSANAIVYREMGRRGLLNLEDGKAKCSVS